MTSTPEQVIANIRSLEATLANVNQVLDSLWKESEGSYCKALDEFQKPECLGWEAKVRTGVFGKAEFDAHKKGNGLIGRHHGLAHAVLTVRAALQSAADTPAPQTHLVGPDTTTIAAHMKDFEAFVAQTAPKLHWKVYRDLGADPSRSNGYYDGWQHGFGEALFGPLPLSELMAEMKASVIAKVAATATEDPLSPFKAKEE